MAKSDVLVRMKADVSNYDANIAKARRSLDQFKRDNLTMGGVLSQVARNMTAAAAGIASVAAAGSAIKSLVQESVQLAKAGEGIRIAFGRLNDATLLNGLREATHNTVSDIELMKAAVKFDDFKLPVQELGTMLAFAQQKAKDTGQSVDYMVDSIVTGLGRKSLMILDNLGLSATEIKEKMKETGDMTKAVGEIIREQMAKSGDYIETAADKAAQADVRLKNAMEELGNTFAPLSAAGSSMWNDLKVGAVELLNDALIPVISAMRTIGMLKDNVGGEVPGYTPDTSYKSQNTPVLGSYVETTDKNGKVIKAQHYNGEVSESQMSDYMSALKKIFSGGGGSGKNTPTYAADSIAAQQALVSDLTKKWNEAGEGVREVYLRSLIDAEAKLKSMKDDQALLKEQLQGRLLEDKAIEIPIQTSLSGSIVQDIDAISKHFKDNPIVIPVETAMKDVEAIQKSARTTAQVVGTIGQAFNAIEDPAARVASTVAMAIANVALAYSDALAKTTGEKFNIWSFIAAAAASTVSMVSTIASIHSATGYAEGGIVGGTSYSGDNIPIMANAGELVLTKAQQNTLAQNLQGGGFGNMNLRTKVKGTELLVWLDNSLAQSGRGELVTWGQ